MNGTYMVQLRSKRINYDLEIKRKITIVRGESGTGKTSLISLLGQALAPDPDIHLNCSAKCQVLADNDTHWNLTLEETNNAIFFLDESFRFISTKMFVRAVQQSDNYFVIVTRNNFDNSMLPYSMDEIFEINNSGRYNRAKPLYSHDIGWFDPTHVVVEDSNSGYEFFSKACKTGVICASANGNSNIVSTVRKVKGVGNRILVVADAAAFGPYISAFVEAVEADPQNSYYLLAPESFECMILSCEMFQRNQMLMRELAHPEKYITADQLSWEQFYTDTLVSLTDNTPASYSKKKLCRCYCENCCYTSDRCQFYTRGDKILIVLGEYAEALGLAADAATSPPTIALMDKF